MNFPSFRAWDPNLKCWDMSVGVLDFSADGEVICPHGWNLSMSTGIVDKTGRMVWTGDVIRCDKATWYASFRYRTQEEFDALPEFDETVDFSYELFSFRASDYPRSWTVIGNVLEDVE